MPLIKRSRNSIWRVWSGQWRVGAKTSKKKVGVNVTINIRSDKLTEFSETNFVSEVSDLLRKYASKFDPNSEIRGCYGVVK